METIDTLVVGAGQAGIAVSRHLTEHRVPHLILEKDRIAEAWRSGRWDDLVTNGPVWHDRFPDLEFEGDAPDAFVGKDRVVAYLEQYAKQHQAPIRTGVEVLGASRTEGEAGFLVETSKEPVRAQRIVAATGAFQHPVIPGIVPDDAGCTQMHSYAYRNPRTLAPGSILVVGSGSSGAQIADELNRAGRRVFLSVGPHDRPPRRYRGRDFVWWLGVLGLWDLAAMEPGTEHVTIAVSGAYGGQTMDFRRLAQEGVNLVGMTRAYSDGVMHFADDLQTNMANGDASYLGMLQAADRYVHRMGLDLPEEPDAHVMLPDPSCLSDPILTLDLGAEEVSTIIWATGYRRDYDWMKFDAFDGDGAPIHQRGISTEPDVYFLGLPWQSRRGSTFLWGVWHDAKFVADQIAIRRAYELYRP
ncbi:flavin-containing monooxygenase [Pseudaestuariivita atlantica]|uniref:flavin-containing monooxygenase n=1 Tax=Pseudaestuariivita atlantica TaxID=1317121 RepID=UPI000A50587E|nr:NAD(P)/FAD-dependent oxidoreductase [Pseudaestuariivita atlantica]